MAKIKFGMHIADMRGSLGGAVLLKGKGGNVVRQAVIPVKRNVGQIVSSNQAFGASVRQWRLLTVAQRASWNAAAQQFSTTDALGNSIIMNGFGYYTRVCRQNLTISGSLAAGVPTLIQLGSLSNGTPTLNRTGSSFTPACSYVGSVSGIFIVISASPPLSPGIFSPLQHFKVLAFNPVVSINANFYTAYTAAYGVPPIGSKIFVRAYAATTQTGQRTANTYSSGIVV